MSALSRHREVIAVELRGQGPANSNLPVTETNVGLAAQAADLEALVEAAGLGGGGAPVDVAGFSFGGRVALAFAATRPETVRRVVVTSVAGSRNKLGAVILKQWESLLAEGACESLVPYGWAAVMETHSDDFLTKNAWRVEGWAALVAQANTRRGLEAIVKQTMQDYDAPYAAMVGASGVRGLMVVGAEDRLVDAASAEEFAKRAGFALSVYDECSHAVPLEAAVRWRKEVLAFLDAPDGPPGGSASVTTPAPAAVAAAP